MLAGYMYSGTVHGWVEVSANMEVSGLCNACESSVGLCTDIPVLASIAAACVLILETYFFSLVS